MRILLLNELQTTRPQPRYRQDHCRAPRAPARPARGCGLQDAEPRIDNRGAGIDLDAVVEALKSRLPNFNPEAVAA